MLGQVYAILLVDLEEAATSDKVVLRLTHAFISKTVQFLDVALFSLHGC